MSTASKGLTRAQFDQWAVDAIKKWNHDAGVSVPAPTSGELGIAWDTYSHGSVASSIDTIGSTTDYTDNTLLTDLGQIRGFGTGVQSGTATASQLAHYQGIIDSRNAAAAKAAKAAKASAGPAGSSGGTGQAGSAPGPAPNAPVAPDIQSALAKSGLPPAAAALLSSMIGQGAQSNVTIWPTKLGVDPKANVRGALLSGAPHGYGRLPPDQTETADLWLKGLYTMQPQDLAALQHRLYDGGWYNAANVTNPSQIKFGRPDQATIFAYGAVLGETARYNAAGNMVNIDGVIGLGSPDQAPKLPAAANRKLVNPQDLTSALTGASQQMLGHDPTAADTAGYQQQYASEEDAARRQIIAQGGDPNSVAQVTGLPSPSAGAEAYVNTHDLADKIAYGAAVRQQAFFNMLHSPV